MRQLLILLSLLTCGLVSARRHTNVLVLTEGQGQHKPMSDAALKWLVDESNSQHFTLQVMSSPNLLDREGALDAFDLIIQLDYPPFAWNAGAARNFERYIEEGRGSWIGFHHASLLGEFEGYKLWNWFSGFLGGIVYKNYVAETCDGTMTNEKPEHPVMKNVPKQFMIEADEWYTYDRSPRPDVEVLASVDENTYTSDTKVRMGDHPVVWTNPKVKAPNVYFQIGHSPSLYQNAAFLQMFRNAIDWVLDTSSKD